MTYAQEKAVIDRKNYKIVFDFGKKQYQLLEPAVVEGKTSFKPVRDRFGRTYTLPQGLSFDDPKAAVSGSAKDSYRKEILFYPDGRCDELAIKILDKSSNGYLITAKGFGGLVRTKEVKGAE